MCMRLPGYSDIDRISHQYFKYQTMTQPSGFRRVARDIADLCELQAELIAVDSKAAVRHSGIAAALLMTAAILGLSATTATVFAIASLLHEQALWTVSNSLLAAALGAAVISGLLIVIGSLVLKKAMATLDETRSELAENLRWIKEAIIAPESSQRAEVEAMAGKRDDTRYES